MRKDAFILKKTTELTDYGAKAMELEHALSGMKVYFIKNSDKEAFFSYTVYTPPENSKGIAHIIEHTVLAGSEKYPVKDPFVVLLKNSPNTYLNALTAADRTYFPAASTVEKDFLNIFSVYTDAVFRPLLRKQTFMQEGIRISSEGDEHFEGVVFSEMLGALSRHEAVVSSESSRPLFGDGPYMYESGGDPREICKLTYEEYIAQYRKWYVPSNMSLFFYGDIDIEKYLGILDEEYLSKTDRGIPVERVPFARRWNEPKRRFSVSAASGSDPGSVMVSWLLGENSIGNNNLVLSLITDILLGSPGCPLYREIAGSSLGDNLSSESGMQTGYRELVFSVGFSGAKESDASEIEEFIIESLKKIVSHGFGETAVEGAIRRAEFNLKEIHGGMPFGMGLFFKSESAFTFGHDPFDILRASDAISEVRACLNENPRFFEEWIDENLIKNPHRLLSVIGKDGEEFNRVNDDISKVLSERIGNYPKDDEIGFMEFRRTEDSPEAVSSVPRITRDDISPRFSPADMSVVNGIHTIRMPSGGIVYTDILIDISDFTYDEIDLINIFATLLTMCGASGLDYTDIQERLRYVSGGSAFFVESGSASDGKEKVFFVMRLKSLPELQGDGLDVFRLLLTEADIKPDRIKAALTDIITDFRSNITLSGHSYAVSAAESALSASAYLGERISGITCFNNLLSISEDITDRMKRVSSKLADSSRMSVFVSSDGKNSEKSAIIASKFVDSFPKLGNRAHLVHRVPKMEAQRAYTVPIPVSYIAIAGRGVRLSDESAARMRIFSVILSSTELWSRIRERNGAYGTGFITDLTEGLWAFYSYRDPRIDGTIDDFFESLGEARITKEMLDDAVISEEARTLRPEYPAAESLTTIRRLVYGISEDDRKRNMERILNLTLPDIEKAREEFLSLASDTSICVMASEEAVSSSSRHFSIEKLPG